MDKMKIKVYSTLIHELRKTIGVGYEVRDDLTYVSLKSRIQNALESLVDFKFAPETRIEFSIYGKSYS